MPLSIELGESMSELRISCKPKWTFFIDKIAFLGVGFGVFVSLPFYDGTGPFGIEASSNIARVICWGMAVLALWLLGYCFVGVFNCFSSRKEIVITNDSITAPKSIYDLRDVTVRFADVVSLQMQTLAKDKALVLECLGGKKLSVCNVLFSDDASFDQIVTKVRAKTDV